MSRPWIIAAALSVVATALLAHLPLRLHDDALGRLGFGAADLQGPAWRAHAPSAHWRGRELGAVDLRLQAWPLLIGQQRLQVQGGGFALTVVRGRRRGVLDATGSWPLGLEPAVAGLHSSLRVAGFDALFSAGRCVHVDGAISLEVSLPAPEGGTPMELSLHGTPRCDGEALVATLTGAGQPGGGHGPEADLRVRGDGNWRLDTRLPATDPALAAGAGLAGFQLANGHYSRVDTGSLFDQGRPLPPRR